MDSNRDETAAERYDRNWLDLIQEPRVAQTGVQVLAGFLLTVPFSFGFKDIANYERVLFLVAVGLAMLTIGLMIAPVAMHRLLFGRRKRRPRQGRGPHRQVRAGLTAGAVVLAFYALVWVALPMSLQREAGRY